MNESRRSQHKIAQKLVIVFVNEQDRVVSDSVDRHDINGTEIVCATMKKADSSILQLKTVMWSFCCISSYYCQLVRVWVWDSADVAVGSLPCYIITTMTKPEHKQMNGSILSVQYKLAPHIKVAMVIQF